MAVRSVCSRPTLGTASGCSLHRMVLQNPVANIDGVDVLLHDDVARKRTVMHPITKAPLLRARVRPVGAPNVTRDVVRLAARDLAQRAAVNALHHFDEHRAIADLEPDVKAELALSLLADFDHL